MVKDDKSTVTCQFRIFDNMFDGVSVYKLIFNDKSEIIDGILEYMNPATVETMDLNLEDVIGKNAIEIFGLDFIQPHLNAINELYLTGKKNRFEAYYVPTDKYFIVSGFDMANGYFAILKTDITQQKKAEEHFHKEVERESFLLELYKSAPQLTDKELFERALDHSVSLTNSSIGFFHLISDDQKNIILDTWNREALKICDALFKTHYPIEQAGNWTDCIQAKSPVVYNDFKNSPNRKGFPKGHVSVKRFISVPVFDEDKVKFIFGVGNKIEEYDNYDIIQIQSIANELYRIVNQRHWEQALKEAHDNLEIKVTERTEELDKLIGELKRSNDELQSFAYITSHDLQEPLRTIASYAQLLERRYKGKLDPDADEFIDFMVDGASRMKEMIQGLLDYSRIGTRGHEFMEFESEDVLNYALRNLRSAISENSAEVTHDELPIIFADEDQIIRVFQNLIGNALKFRREGVKPKIHISARKERNEYVFSVSDNGIGLEEQYNDKIFEVFKRLHAIGEYQGAGIGLAIVKRIIDRHDGRIWVESELGNGSTFYFTISKH